jgi:hypothetical protein
MSVNDVTSRDDAADLATEIEERILVFWQNVENDSSIADSSAKLAFVQRNDRDLHVGLSGESAHSVIG